MISKRYVVTVVDSRATDHSSVDSKRYVETCDIDAPSDNRHRNVNPWTRSTRFAKSSPDSPPQLPTIRSISYTDNPAEAMLFDEVIAGLISPLVPVRAGDYARVEESSAFEHYIDSFD